MPRNVRGRQYRIVMTESTPILVERCRQIRAATGKLTTIDIVRLSIEVDLPVKTTFNFLEYADILPYGTWERVIIGRTVKQLIDAAQG